MIGEISGILSLSSTNVHNRVLYTGVTSDLKRRVYQHREECVGSFTARYNVNKLVYYEVFSDPYNIACWNQE